MHCYGMIFAIGIHMLKGARPTSSGWNLSGAWLWGLRAPK